MSRQTGLTMRAYCGKRPRVAASAYIDPSAVVIGDVEIAEDASLWPLCVARGDVHTLTIGKGTNIQDLTMLHATHDSKYTPGGRGLEIGAYVTVGHRCVLHACRIEDYALVGMSSTVMDGATVCSRAMLGAGTLVPEGKRLEGGYLYLGAPARQVRKLSERENEFLEYSAQHYIRMKNRYLDAA